MALSPHHLRGGAVLVLVVQVTMSVVGLDEAPQPAVQGQVRHVIRSKHQQVVGLLPPADFLLRTRVKRRGDGFCAVLACVAQLKSHGAII